MTVGITSAVLAAIRAEAAVSPEMEVCGLLLGAPRHVGPVPASTGGLDPAAAGLVQRWMPGQARHDQIRGSLPAANVAADPFIRFEIDPSTLFAAHRAARRGGPAILGCYHSHPRGPAAPSAVDAASAAADGQLWLILDATGAATLWRAVARGAMHGRFDPVAFAETPPGNAPALRHGRGREDDRR